MKSVALISFILMMLCACENETIDPIDQNAHDIIFKTGTNCGWCAGSDSLIISNYKINYGRHSPCDDNDVFKEESISQSLFNNLLNNTDYDAFKAININTCYVCADGCDTWIEIKMDDKSHKITFGSPDSAAIESIRPLYDILDSLRQNFTHRLN